MRITKEQFTKLIGGKFLDTTTKWRDEFCTTEYIVENSRVVRFRNTVKDTEEYSQYPLTTLEKITAAAKAKGWELMSVQYKSDTDRAIAINKTHKEFAVHSVFWSNDTAYFEQGSYVKHLHEAVSIANERAGV